MKKIMLSFIVLAALVPTLGNAETLPKLSSPIHSPAEPPDVKAMLNRLEEIRDIDKSHLKPSERKALRKEVRSIKKDIKANNGGVYLSVGALLLVIVLLIILL